MRADGRPRLGRMNRRDVIRTAAFAGAALTTGLRALDAAAPRSVKSPLSEDAGGSGQETEILIRGGRVVNHDGSRVADVRIRGDRVVEIGSGLAAGSEARKW